MKILSHRGYWLKESEKNKLDAFRRSFDLGYGTETDLRDCNREIVISHDMPLKNEIYFEELLQAMNGRNLPLALNIKSDGLIDDILNILKKYNHTNYFTFDMSIPDMICQLKKKAKVFCPFNDIVKSQILLSECEGVWLDSFNSFWYDNSTIENIIEKNKKVCVVSEDLHKRDNRKQWEFLSKNKFIESENLMICTDKFEDARKFFSIYSKI